MSLVDAYYGKGYKPVARRKITKELVIAAPSEVNNETTKTIVESLGACPRCHSDLYWSLQWETNSNNSLRPYLVAFCRGVYGDRHLSYKRVVADDFNPIGACT